MKKLRIIAIALILLGIGGFTANYFLSTEQEEELPVAAPTPTGFVFPTETPTPTIPIATSSAQATPPVSSRDTTTGLNRATLSVEVLNGSGVTGAASKMAQVLKDLGYTIASIGNASSTDYIDVTIEIKSTKSNFVNLLKKDLEGVYTVASSSAQLSATASADAIIIVGK